MTKLYIPTLAQAIDYVREKKDWDEHDEKSALRKMDLERIPLSLAAPDIVDSIHDLMEEYSEDNELPEEWWYEYTDEEEIFMCL